MFTREDIPSSFKSALTNRSKDIFLTVHSPIASLRNTDFKDYMIDCLDFANEINARIFTIHGNFFTKKRIYADLIEIIEKADNYNIKIGIENIFMTPTHFNEIIEKLENYANVGITFDIGHSQLAQIAPEIKERNALKYLKNIKGPIIEVHAHNNDGQGDDHLRIMEGIIPVDEILKELVEVRKFNGPIIFEYARGHELEDINYIKNLLHR